jgi:hypothetical protein
MDGRVVTCPRRFGGYFGKIMLSYIDTKQKSYSEFLRVGFTDAQAIALIELIYSQIPLDIELMVEKLIAVGFTDLQADTLVMVKLAGTITFGSQYPGVLIHGDHKAAIVYDNRNHIMTGRLLETRDNIGFQADNFIGLRADFVAAIPEIK